MIADRIQNSVLSELAKSDRKVFLQLMQDLDPHPLQRGAVLGSVRANTDYAYFIESGVVSLVANTKNGSSVEVALVGREGVAGIADALAGTRCPTR
jgi:CRP-like cAMP-binding protein